MVNFFLENVMKKMLQAMLLGVSLICVVGTANASDSELSAPDQMTTVEVLSPMMQAVVNANEATVKDLLTKDTQEGKEWAYEAEMNQALQLSSHVDFLSSVPDYRLRVWGRIAHMLEEAAAKK